MPKRDRKHMTLRERAARFAQTPGDPTGYGEPGLAEGYIAGWHARGRADRVTKAERINADMLALLEDIKANSDQHARTRWIKDTPEVVALRRRLAKIIERAKGRK